MNTGGNRILAATTAGALTAAHIGRVLLVAGTWFGGLTDYEIRGRDVRLYLGGKVVTVPRTAICAWEV